MASANAESHDGASELPPSAYWGTAALHLPCTKMAARCKNSFCGPESPYETHKMGESRVGSTNQHTFGTVVLITRSTNLCCLLSCRYRLLSTTACCGHSPVTGTALEASAELH